MTSSYSTTEPLQIAPGFLPTAGGPMSYDMPVTTGPPAIQLSPEYAYSLNDQIATSFPEEHHYKLNLVTSGPTEDRQREKFNTMSNQMMYPQYTVY